MSDSAPHIIARQSYRFRLPAATDMAELQRLCNDELPSRLNQVFDGCCDAETVLRIEHLDIRLNIDPADISVETIGQKLVAAVSEALQEYLHEGKIRSGRKTDLDLDALLFYFENGFLPWWGHGGEEAPLEDRLERCSDTDFLRFRNEFRKLAQHSPAAIHRLRELLPIEPPGVPKLQRWCNFSAPLADAVLALLHATHERNVLLSSHDSFYRKANAAILASFLSQAQDEHAQLQIFLGELDDADPIDVDAAGTQSIGRNAEGSRIPHPEFGKLKLALRSLKDRTNAAVENGTRSGDSNSQEVKILPRDPSPSDRIRIPNAGLALIAPYFRQLFETCGIVTNDVLTDQPKAIALLRTCAAGAIRGAEHAIVLEKILCGMEPADSPGELPSLSEEEIAECDALLHAVVSNWPALKQTSVDGLRQSFLQREGLLQRKDGSWQLRVQRQAHDILLDYIPWGFSIVRTPWMSGMMFVDWSS